MKRSILLIGLFVLMQVQAKAPKTQQAYSLTDKTVKVYTTAKTHAEPMAYKGELRFEDKEQPTEREIIIFVDPAKQYQALLGIGGAVSDASAETFAKMPRDKQQLFIDKYYDKQDGIGYSLLRTTIHSSDFASGSYTYVADNDSVLSTFTIEHDHKYRIPLIHKIIDKAGGKITTYASPWSPPAWMKSNANMLRGGKLLPRYHQTWANYFVKFIREYEKAGIPIWGITVQNEPMATQTWESCIFTGKEEAAFVKKYLGPTMARNGMRSKKIIAWDHNRDLIFQRATDIYSDPEAAKYIWGLGFHWYETWSKGLPQFDNIRRVKEAYPDKNLMFTEGCVEKFEYSGLNDWELGERYGEAMINDFNNGASGWTDWNILLDEKGGPNHAGNFCFAPVHYNTQTGELIFNNEFYYIGHFSKYIRPGAKRLATSSSRSVLQATSFMNTDGKLAVVVMNKGDLDLEYFLWINNKAVKTLAPARSINTLIVN